MLIINHLIVGYNVPCVNPISFEIDAPGVYGIIGPNGSGKSTFLKTIIGLIPQISGTFEVVSLHKRAYVPQAHTVNRYFHLSLRDFVLQGYGPHDKETKSEYEKADMYLKEWQLTEQMNKCFHELSGGQKTRAMIVRALISNPDMICLDEPLTSLDSCCQLQLMETLSHLAQHQKKYILISDHHLEKFKNFVNGWLEFTKHHDDTVSSVQYVKSHLIN